MKTICKSATPPSALKNYVAKVKPNSPDDKWDAFCDQSSTAKREVQTQLHEDQRSLCAYCEIDITPHCLQQDTTTSGNADFRVEHFHPQSDTGSCSPNGISWGLDWNNMLACCSGGNDSMISAPGRCAGKKNHHCDVPKSNKVLDGIILNPLTDVPPFPCLFDTITGDNADEIFLKPNKDHCNAVGSDRYAKAQGTIKELNLNCTVLARFRHAAIGAIDKQIKSQMKGGKDYDTALDDVMSQVYGDSSSTAWPAFFTTIRAHYGSAAEKRLNAINYQG